MICHWIHTRNQGASRLSNVCIGSDMSIHGCQTDILPKSQIRIAELLI